MSENEEARSVIDEQDAAALPATNPNIAAGRGDYDHEAHIGGDAEDDLGVAEAASRLDFGGDGQAT